MNEWGSDTQSPTLKANTTLHHYPDSELTNLTLTVSIEGKQLNQLYFIACDMHDWGSDTQSSGFMP